MMTTDLRGDLDKIASPTLVLGTWIAYKQYATREEVEKNFRTQYAKLKNYDFVLSIVRILRRDLGFRVSDEIVQQAIDLAARNPSNRLQRSSPWQAKPPAPPYSRPGLG